jgi:hypothetical protein
MNTTQKIIHDLSLIDLNGLDWIVEPDGAFIPDMDFEIESAGYTLEINAYLEMNEDLQIFAMVNKISIYDSQDEEVHLSETDLESIAKAFNEML